ncbi:MULTISPECIES: DNA/RNA endonuclease G [unclassified Microbacterium]|uniref:DNA/RNA endonuclease G n=1 Tax=unclassified Microbacterium TaxID=2609290 RepID=UPI0038697242
MTTTPVLRRVVRRETHSPRTVAMIVAVALVIAALAYVAVEVVLYLAAQPALVAAPGDVLAWASSLPENGPAGLVIAAGVVIALIGLWLVIVALTPGRLSKHELSWGGRAVVVDNGVLAAALARHLSDETGIEPDRITVGVGHRSVDVTVRPAPGIPLDESAVTRLSDAEVSRWDLARSVRTRVRIARQDQKEDAA